MTFSNFCLGVVALSNAVAAWSFFKFSRVGIEEIKLIRKSTDVVRYHILREVKEKRMKELGRG